MDHFSFSNNDRFQLKYLINDTYWDAEKGGPIFFYAGNEAPIEEFAENTVRICIDILHTYLIRYNIGTL